MIKQSKGKAPLKSLMLGFSWLNPAIIKSYAKSYIGSAMYVSGFLEEIVMKPHISFNIIRK